MSHDLSFVQQWCKFRQVSEDKILLVGNIIFLLRLYTYFCNTILDTFKKHEYFTVRKFCHRDPSFNQTTQTSFWWPNPLFKIVTGIFYHQKYFIVEWKVEQSRHNGGKDDYNNLFKIM